MTQQLLERLASLRRSECRTLLSEHGLQPVHLEALNYLSVCNRYSDTPKAVTEFLGQTKGTVSQTLKVLEKKHLLEKVTDTQDRRVTHLSLTKAGVELVTLIQGSASLVAALDSLAPANLNSINVSLKALLTSYQENNNYLTFGQCLSCIHNIKQGDGRFLCGLTQEALSQGDVELICREHTLD